jgi:hypothetical protein
VVTRRNASAGARRVQHVVSFLHLNCCPQLAECIEATAPECARLARRQQTVLWVLALLLTVAPIPLSGQIVFVAPSPEKRKECQYEYLLAGLHLTAAQRDSARKLISDWVDTTVVIYRQMGPNKKSYDVRHALELNMHEDIKAMLKTADDSLRADKNVIDWNRAFRAGRCHGEPPGG